MTNSCWQMDPMQWARSFQLDAHRLLKSHVTALFICFLFLVLSVALSSWSHWIWTECYFEFQFRNIKKDYKNTWNLNITFLLVGGCAKTLEAWAAARAHFMLDFKSVTYLSVQHWISTLSLHPQFLKTHSLN